MSEAQLPLFDRGPTVPHNGSETSRAAAESIVPHVNNLEAQVIEAMRELGNATCDEVEKHTGMRHQTCSARFRGLAQRGLIQRVGSQRKTRSGRMAQVWEVV